jgi:hypothetical protein
VGQASDPRGWSEGGGWQAGWLAGCSGLLAAGGLGQRGWLQGPCVGGSGGGAGGAGCTPAELLQRAWCERAWGQGLGRL